jgi:hypothetical protein
MAQLFTIPDGKLIEEAVVQRHEALVGLVIAGLQQSMQIMERHVVPQAQELYRSLGAISTDREMLSSPAIMQDIDKLAKLFIKIQDLMDCYQAILAEEKNATKSK